ncbi:MAG: damage-control phosphatase ARMT1 family protein [Pseudonocardiaceae bacterium]
MADGAARESIPDSSPIFSNVPGSFAWGVFHQRHPALVKQMRDAFPYPPEQDHALALLGTESSTGVISPLGRPAHDHEMWDGWGDEYVGQRWVDVPFLWAESYFYRKLLDAVGFFEPGPWAGVDPFEPFKNAELNDTALDTELAAMDHVLSFPVKQRVSALLSASLWGNRADLGFRISAGSTTTTHQGADLIVDDTTLLWSLLDSRPAGEICLVADNAGRELLCDLLLIDHLLSEGHAATVTLHVKPYPYYVSDAMTADLLACLRRCARTSGQAADVVGRLWQAMRTGRLVVRTHLFSCAPLSYHHMPADLAQQFSTASLTIMKGDLNYRRLVGDRHWPPTTPFSVLTHYFPGPVAALRTLKSDVVVGLAEPVLSTLDSTGEQWRTSGTHALIQVRP